MIKRSIIAAAGLLLATQSAAQAPVAAPVAAPVSGPSWLAGAWIDSREKGWTEEFWSSERGGVMLGAGRNGTGDRLRGWEQMRLTRGKDGAWTFWASPQGAPAVAFAMTAISATEIAFANPANDYPQRIRYWREGKLLVAEISLADGSKAMRWRYKPMGGGK